MGGWVSVKALQEDLPSFDNIIYTRFISIDLLKTIDSVDHDILLRKLEDFLKLKENHLNRYQYTKIFNVKSESKRVLCGVSQGSSPSPQ